MDTDGDALDVLAAVVSGALIGVLGGLVGLILGALRMPALLPWVGEVPSRAIGTNLAVGFWVGFAGVVGHLPGGVDWTALGAGAAPCRVGSGRPGRRPPHRPDERAAAPARNRRDSGGRGRGDGAASGALARRARGS